MSDDPNNALCEGCGLEFDRGMLDLDGLCDDCARTRTAYVEWVESLKNGGEVSLRAAFAAGRKSN